MPRVYSDSQLLLRVECGVERFRKFLTHYFRFVPPLLLIAVPVYALYGAAVPWPAAKPILAARSGEVPIVVGGGSIRSCSQAQGDQAWSCQKTTQRQYVFIPSFLDRPTITTIAQVNDDPPKISESGPAAGLGAVATFAICAFFTWFVWLRPKRLAPTE